MRRLVILAIFVWLLGPWALPSARAQDESLESLNSQVFRLYGEGRFAEAVPLATPAVSTSR